MNKNLIMTITLMITIMIDIMGLGLVFPLYPDLFYNPKTAIIDLNISENLHNFLYGLVMCSWPIGLFIGAPYFGDLSDKLPRKFVICVCLFATAIIYYATTLAIEYKFFVGFLIARFLSGFVGGSYAIAQAAMVDISTPETKARNLAMITLAASIGFVIGPVITSVTTLDSFADWFSLKTPFYVAAICAFINALVVWWLLPKREASNPGAKVHLWRGFSVVYEVFSDERTRRVTLQFFLMILGWAFYLTILSLLLYENFDYSSSGVALVFAVSALSNISATIFIQPYLFRHWSVQRICTVMGIILSLLLFTALCTAAVAVQWFVVVTASGVQLLYYIAMMTMFSDSVGDQEQGKVMGGADSTAALGWVVNSFLTGLLIDKSLLLPILIGAVCVGLSVVFFVRKNGS